jgi:hypothetical protein
MKMKNSVFNDGANWQAQAVAAYVVGNTGIETDYPASVYEPEIARWHNCREQGYVISFSVASKQLNIAFFEHRNSDSICAVMWEQRTINPPNIDSAQFGDIYKDKYDTSYSTGYGEVVKMGGWICERLQEFVAINKKKETPIATPSP